MRSIELLESLAEQELCSELVKIQNQCKLLENKFPELISRNGYNAARELVLSAIPDIENIKFYIEIVCKSNKKLASTYIKTQKIIVNLTNRINSGI